MGSSAEALPVASPPRGHCPYRASRNNAWAGHLWMIRVLIALSVTVINCKNRV